MSGKASGKEFFWPPKISAAVLFLDGLRRERCLADASEITALRQRRDPLYTVEELPARRVNTSRGRVELRVFRRRKRTLELPGGGFRPSPPCPSHTTTHTLKGYEQTVRLATTVHQTTAAGEVLEYQQKKTVRVGHGEARQRGRSYRDVSGCAYYQFLDRLAGDAKRPGDNAILAAWKSPRT